MGSLNTRVEKLEQATHRTKPPKWYVALCGMCGIAPEDVDAGPVQTIEDVIAGPDEPDTAGRNRTESSL